jgi:hypothetical protein
MNTYTYETQDASTTIRAENAYAAAIAYCAGIGSPFPAFYDNSDGHADLLTCVETGRKYFVGNATFVIQTGYSDALEVAQEWYNAMTKSTLIEFAKYHSLDIESEDSDILHSDWAGIVINHKAGLLRDAVAEDYA